MKTAKRIPMWAGAGTGGGFDGAALFGATSMVKLTSTLPNLFGTDGDYIEFKAFIPDLSTPQTILGSTLSPDAVYYNETTIYVTDGTTTVSLDFNSSLSINTWYLVRLYRQYVVDGSYLLCDVDSITQVDTAAPVAIDINLVAKNQVAYSDVIAAKLAGYDGDYFRNVSPSTALKGSNAGFWRSGWFYLDSVGNHCLEDCLQDDKGWRIEVENVYLSAHRLVFTVGNGVTSVQKKSAQVFSERQWVYFYVDLEDLGVTPPDPGDTVIVGFEPSLGDFYLGAYSDQSVVCNAKLDSFYGGDGNLDANQKDWLYNNGFGRVVDEFGVGTTVSTSDIAFGWGLSEASGTRYDSFGTDDLTPVPGSPLSDSFEAVTGGVFDNWSIGQSGASTVNVEEFEVRTGTYSCRIDVDSVGSDASILNYSQGNFTPGKEYNLSFWAKTTGPMTVRVQPNMSVDSVDKSVNSVNWMEVTHTYTDFGSNLRLTARTGNNLSLYIDDVVVTTSEIITSPGLQTSHATAASFVGYLKDVKLSAAAGYVYLPLYDDAVDIGGDSNDGTATNVTFVAVDPGA